MKWEAERDALKAAARRGAVALAVLGLVSGLTGHASTRARTVPAGCSWHYNVYVQNDNQLGSYVQLWITGTTCVSSYRAHLVCVYPRGGATATFYGVTVRPSARSTARCNSSSEPDILYEDDNFTNGTHATYEDWHR